MKKWLCWILLPVALCGCSQQKTLETISDEYVQPTVIAMQQIAVDIPDGAVVSVMADDESGSIYFCDGYTMTLQTMVSGDLNETVNSVTGYDASQLELIETASGNANRYDCVWVSAGEGEEQVCRGAILDDGNYHYVLTCMTDASNAQSVEECWQTLFRSFCLTTPGENPYTGS